MDGVGGDAGSAATEDEESAAVEGSTAEDETASEGETVEDETMEVGGRSSKAEVRAAGGEAVGDEGASLRMAAPFRACEDCRTRGMSGVLKDD